MKETNVINYKWPVLEQFTRNKNEQTSKVDEFCTPFFYDEHVSIIFLLQGSSFNIAAWWQ